MSKSIQPRSFIKNVTSAGTAVALSATSLIVKSFLVKAKSGNTNDIYLGDSTVDAATGFPLDSSEVAGGEEVSRGIHSWYDLSKWFIDADTNGEGVAVLYEKVDND